MFYLLGLMVMLENHKKILWLIQKTIAEVRAEISSENELEFADSHKMSVIHSNKH